MKQRLPSLEEDIGLSTEKSVLFTKPGGAGGLGSWRLVSDG